MKEVFLVYGRLQSITTFWTRRPRETFHQDFSIPGRLK